MPRKAKKIPEVLTPDEQKLLLRQPNKRYPTGLRNLAMMTLMLDSGLRASEVLKLTLADIEWRAGKLKVREGKGRKDRILWLSDNCLEILRLWKERRPEGTDLLFLTLDAKPIHGSYLRRMVKRYAKKAGIEKDVHPHTLRHSFATDFYRETKNLRMVQSALGHSDISTTQIYTHIIDEELEEAMRGFRRKRD